MLCKEGWRFRLGINADMLALGHIEISVKSGNFKLTIKLLIAIGSLLDQAQRLQLAPSEIYNPPVVMFETFVL